MKDTATPTGTPETGDGPIEEQIIRMASLNYERLPMLEAIFDRFALSLGAILKTYTGTLSEVSLESFDYMAVGPALDSLGGPSLLLVTEASPWDGRLALSIDPPLLFTTLEIMLGGRSVQAKNWTPRSFTAIEKRLGQKLGEVVLAELVSAFDHVDKVKFNVSHLESSPQNAVLAPPTSASVKIVLKVDFEGRGGSLCFIIPDATLEAVRPQLAQSFFGGQLGGDNGWRSLLTQSIQETDVTVTAVLHEFEANLRDVLEWKPGQTIDLGIDMSQEVAVSCSGRTMFRAAVGRRKNGSVALRVTEDLNDQKGGTHGDPD